VTGTSLFTGGTLAGTLNANGGATLDGSTPAGAVFVTGALNGSTLTSTGTIALSGSAAANTIIIASGTLTNTGTLAAINQLDIAGGATLVANGAQSYALLTTSGAGGGIWQGNLTNTTTVAPGGVGGIGTLQVTNGDFTNLTNLTGASLHLDIAAGAHDSLELPKIPGVTRTATFGGRLDLKQLGAAPIAPFVPINVVAADAYAGNFISLSEDIDGVVWFNPGNGDIMRLALPSGGSSTLFGSTANQTSAWIALYDDVIAPNATNITYSPGGNPSYSIISGVADATNPDLLWALTASFTPTGLNPAVLNRLSPEAYGGLSDYALQATRAHQRSAFSAPALAGNSQSISKGDSKAAAPVAPAGLQWELFAATDYFNVESDNSQNQADYELSSFGILGGVRTRLTNRVEVAAYLAGDDGDIKGSLMDADGSGWSLGLLGDALLDVPTSTRLRAGISYGQYNFDGTRSSVAATSTNWSPGLVNFSDVASDSLELFVGVDGIIYHNDRFRLSPSFGLRAATGSMDSFAESTGSAPGSPLALAVDQDHYNSVLAELSLLAEAELTTELTVWGQLGGSAGIGDDPHALTAHFVKGSRPFTATAEGLANDSWFLGLGASYKLSESIRVGLGYRAEFRADADTQNSLNLSSTFRF
jgi:hypothetical protein